MAEYRVTGPNGEEYVVTGPDDAPQEELISVISQFASGVTGGALRTLDVVPQALGSLANIASWALTGENPQFNPTPFLNVGQYGGLGARVPETKAEKAAQFTGEMIGATALPAGLAAKAAAPAARLRTLGVEGASLGGAIGGGLVGRELGGTTGELAGTIAGGLAPAAAPFAARAVLSPAGQFQMGENLAAAQRAGVPLSAGQAAGGSFIEKGSATLPGAQAMAEQFRARQAATMGERTRAIAGQLAPEASQEAAGRSIRQGLAEFTDQFRARGNELYTAAESLIPPQTPVALRATKGKLDDLVMDEEFSAILDSPLVRSLNKALAEKQAVPYEVAAALRSKIGERLAGSDLIADAPKGQLKALYGAMSKDLDEVATAISPQAEQAAKRASNYWRAGRKRIDDFLDPIQKRKIPEKVYTAAMAGTNEGASRIRTLKKSLSPERWDAVVGTTINRLGRTVPSARTTGELLEEATDFSPQTFLTNLERMDSAARKVLFSGSRYANLERGMQDLQTTAQAIRSQNLTAYNPSGTAGAIYNTAGMALPTLGIMGNVPGTTNIAMGLGLNAAIQKALLSPNIANWLARPTAFQPSIAAQLARPYSRAQE